MSKHRIPEFLKKFGESNGVEDNNYYCYSDTDSVVGDTLIQTSIGKIKIQDLYNVEGEETVLANDSYVKKPSSVIMTYSVSKDLKLNNNNIKYIMKHKVKKRMFKIKTPEQEVIVTEDHSVMILRNNILTEVKSKDIVKGDKIIRLVHNVTMPLEYKSKFEIEDLGTQEIEVYDIEVENDHNFFGNDILVHNSCYFTLQPISHVLYDSTDDNNTKADKIDNFIKTKIDPVIEENNKEFCDFVNALDSTVVKAEREVIADSAVFVAKKRYFMRVLDNEGVRYETPKIKRMGIEIVRSSTPSFSKKYLDDSINIILDKNNKDLLEWVKETKQLFTKQKLSEIAKTSSVSNLNYSLDKVQYDQNGRKISVPINSRAALVTNRYIEQNNLSNQFQPISPNDKIKILYMKTPNPLNSNVMAFIDNRFAEMFRQYVDFDENWDKFFLAALEIMTNPLNYDLGNQKEELDVW